MSAVQIPTRLLVIGYGSVARAALPLILDHVPPAHVTVIDSEAVPVDRSGLPQGVTYEVAEINESGYAETLARYVGAGDMVLDLAWNLDTVSLLRWCSDNGVRYVNASVEVWNPYELSGADATLHVRQRAVAELGREAGPTAVLDHGANPGLVSHLVRRALLDVAAYRGLEMRGSWGELARDLGVRVIHVSERDTQIGSRPKEVDEFVNTWSVEGFHEELCAPAEIGWGSHEAALPEDGHLLDDETLYLDRSSLDTWVRSWVPSGEILGMVVRHGESLTIAKALTFEDYRPTVHYAYCPCDAALASIHELKMRRERLQPRQRIMYDEIVSGRDELGVLLMGDDWSWWTGSTLGIDEARELLPGQNATTVQVAAGILGAVAWALEAPEEGVTFPDDLPHEFVLDKALPYLGPIVSTESPFRPASLQTREVLGGERVPA